MEVRPSHLHRWSRRHRQLSPHRKTRQHLPPGLVLRQKQHPLQGHPQPYLVPLCDRGKGRPEAPPAGRPGGAPRGVALIEGGGLDLEQWLRDQNNECTRAGYPKECLAIRYVGEYVGDDPTDSRNKNCTVLIDEPSSFEQRDDTKYVKRDTPLTVNVSCDPLDESGDNPPDESGDNPPDESDDNPPDKSGGAGE